MVPANLYDPHAKVEKEGKIGPGPGQYSIPGTFPELLQKDQELDEDQMNLKEKLNNHGGKFYVENNLDRFG